MSGRGRRTAAAALALAGLAAPGPATAAGEIQPGAYCPLPRAGEKPKCLAPAQAEYAEFFSALEAGEVDAAESARIESDVAAGASQNGYLALSSLSYGYLRLAEQVAGDPQAHPALVARLERWNALLARAYRGNAANEDYRVALRVAARDIAQHAPAVRLRCLDAEGAETECTSTEAVLRGFDATAGEVGFGGALLRIYRRFLGREDS